MSPSSFLTPDEFQFPTFWNFGQFQQFLAGMFILVIFTMFLGVFIKKMDALKGMERKNATLLRSTSISLETDNKKLDSRDTVKWCMFWPKLYLYLKHLM